MDRKMRRFVQMLPESDVKQILNDATNGVLSMVDVDGVPYGVPLSFVYDGEKTIYMHGAKNGHKNDCILNNNNVSFCVVAQDRIVPEEFTTYFRSVIVTGTISSTSEMNEIVIGLEMLCNKYSAGIDSTAEIKQQIGNVIVYRLDITKMTGKESIELKRQR